MLGIEYGYFFASVNVFMWLADSLKRGVSRLSIIAQSPRNPMQQLAVVFTPNIHA